MTKKSKVIIIIVAIIAMIAGFNLARYFQADGRGNAKLSNAAQLAEARKKFSPIQGLILSPARKIAVPALMKHDGSALKSDEFKGQWSLLFFGYTHCPDICPTTMAVVAKAKKMAASQNHIFPQVYFVSVDPQRDSVATMSDYVQYFDKDFIGITGQDNLIKAFGLQMSVVYLKMPVQKKSANSQAEGDYAMDHSSALLLLNPKGQLRAFLNSPDNPKIIFNDFKTVLKQK